jgi:DNA-binding CsgD family transcriptional regulator
MRGMDTTDAQALNKVVLDLYREGREVPLDSFQAWALEQVKGLITFDSAWWGNAAANPPALHEMHLHNCDQSILEVYPAYLEQDVFRAALIARPGVAINLSDVTVRAQHVRTPLYLEFGRRFNVEWSLGTLLIEPISSLYEFLTVWRHDRKRPFSEAERRTKELLMPHLAEAHRIARLRNFLKSPAHQNREWALADTHGFLREASPAFIARLRAHWPGWGGNSLPEPLASSVKAGRALTSAAVRFDVLSRDPLRYIQIRPNGALDQLSVREREVASRYAQGKTHSAIAEELSLSPATVRNHIASCFRKLTVNNKAELVVRLEKTV